MIIYEGEKYACMNCIRGHRSSSCDHRDRPLFLVRKRGRPTSASKTDTKRVAIIARDNTKPCCRVDKKGRKDVITLDAARKELVDTTDDKITNPRLRVKRKGEATYVPVGNGLYRRLDEGGGTAPDGAGTPIDEPDSGQCCNGNAECDSGSESPSAIFVPHQPVSSAQYMPTTTTTTNPMEPVTTAPAADSDNAYNPITNPIAHPIGSVLVDPINSAGSMHYSPDPTNATGNGTANNDLINGDGTYTPSEQHFDPVNPYAPILIAPMSMEGHEVSELALGPEWQLDSSDAMFGKDVLYTATCALGMCECGDDCACEGCLEHDKGRFSKTSQSQASEVDQRTNYQNGHHAPAT
uniref:ARAD1C15048p n=1 Tax=Blastobotrys adeninivorans TaxID=409370 RepID=A0A060T0A8_BLAAD